MHLRWSLFFLLLFLSSVLISFYISFSGLSLNLFFSLFSSWNTNFRVSFSLDFISSWFCSAVILISIIIFFYSYFYMSPYSKSVYFIWLTFMFVASMLLVITMTRLFFVILGWDGLGLISFLLIVYYQNSSSIFSGLNTVLINRIGDCLFVCSIVSFLFFYSDLFSFSSSLLPTSIIFLLGFTFITKSAIFPFSPWLPLAIAAPTPISALVHSSTLVTSGLFLIMRFSYVFYRNYPFLVFFIVFRVYTSFYAGFNTIFEKDLKKIIALSTLSHLGFIGLAFSSGCLYLSFFHLLVHAFFKSLLFITIGDIIINLSHSQEIRYLSSGLSYTPFSRFIMYVSLLNLCGLPSLSGFFSKDLVLEMLNYSKVSAFLYLLVILNLFFTFYYTFQLFYYTFQLNKLSPYFVFNSPYVLHSSFMFILSTVTIVFGYFFISIIFPFFIFVPVPFLLKLLPLLILFIFLFFIYVNNSLFVILSPSLSFVGSSILLLSYLTTTLSSQAFLSLSSRLSKETEQGFVYYSFNTVAHKVVFLLSKLLLFPVISSPLFVVLICSPLVFIFICFLLMFSLLTLFMLTRKLFLFEDNLIYKKV